MKKSFLFILGLTLLACTPDGGKNERGIINLSPTEKVISKQSNNFAFGLLDATNTTLANNSQVVVSPLSASMALSMAMNGANGETLNEMMDILGFNGTTINEVNTFNNKLMKGLVQLDNTAKINIANSLWLNNITALDTYKQTITEMYDAEIFTQDFTLDAINGWCSKATNGKIGSMYSKLAEDLRFLLLNAIYFKASWATPFTSIEDATFITENGEKQIVPFMNGKHYAKYYECGKFNIYGIPYGNEAFTYYIAMPNEGVSMNECTAELATGSWDDATTIENAMFKGFVDLNLTMPMYETNFKADLVEALKYMGINKAFSEAAEFPRIFNEGNVAISQVLQATTFKVDELGAEASAVTSVEGEITANYHEKIKLVVDRPFIFFVQEQSTGTILFAGKIGKI
ncbi:MAG: serpin family protein [Bacteroidaceae bacterium]|nr:serpin family protein [Bacteroidaceae bacterium]